MNRKNLVIVRAGDSSLHPGWLRDGAARSWDLVVNYFGNDPDRYRVGDVVRMDSKGPKWPALHDLIAANPQFMTEYEYIWLPDDDLEADAASIETLFATCRQYNLEVAQPALTWNSYFGHVTTLSNPKYRLRFTNYVEVMAPCLSASMLRKALPLFNSNLSGWGLDFIWQRLAEQPQTGIAIIDAVTVRHTRAVGGPNYQALRDGGVSPWDELRAFCRVNGLDEAPVITTYDAIGANGAKVTARGRAGRFTLGTIMGYLPALRVTPDRQRMFRRLLGLGFKSMCRIPDRVSETSLLQQVFSR